MREALAREAAELDAIASQQERYPSCRCRADRRQVRELSGKDDPYLLQPAGQSPASCRTSWNDTLTPIKAFPERRAENGGYEKGVNLPGQARRRPDGASRLKPGGVGG